MLVSINFNFFQYFLTTLQCVSINASTTHRIETAKRNYYRRSKLYNERVINSPITYKRADAVHRKIVINGVALAVLSTCQLDGHKLSGSNRARKQNMWKTDCPVHTSFNETPVCSIDLAVNFLAHR